MKKNLRIIFTLIVSSMLAMAFCTAASAEGQVYDEGGVKTVYLSASETVTLADGETTRNAYTDYHTARTALKDAFASVGNVGDGTMYISGTVTVGAYDKWDNRSSVHMTITGLNGQSDVFELNGNFSPNQPVTFDNLTLKSNSKVVFGGVTCVTFGENLKMDGQVTYVNGRTQGSSIKPKAVFNAKDGSYYAISIGSSANSIGSDGSFVEASVEINAGKVDRLYFGALNYGGKTIYGNMNAIVNGGSVEGVYVESTLNHVVGVKTLIFNNGTGSKFTTIDSGINYVVKSAEGGKVDIKTQATKTNNTPTFSLTPNEGLTPHINGTALEKTGDEYLHTPAYTAGTQTVINVEWLDIDSPRVYDENGVNTVYLSAEAKVTLANGETRNAYQSFNTARTALNGAGGGTMYVCGTVTASLDGGTANANHITITGLDENGVLTINNGAKLTVYQPATFENLKINIPSGSAYIMGGYPTVTFGEGLTKTGNGNLIYVNGRYQSSSYSPEAVFNTEASIARIAIASSSNAIGSASSPKNATIIIDNVTAEAVHFGGKDFANTVYGNMNLVINGGTFNNGTSKGLVDVDSHLTHSHGVKTAILNNGMAEQFGSIHTDIDYVVKSAVGGKVDFKSQAVASSSTAPTFILTPDDELIPHVNGVALTADETTGEFTYTPAYGTDAQTEIVVTWKSAEPEKQYVNLTFDPANGETAAVMENVEVGTTVNAPVAPEKTATAQYTYTFKAWSDGTNTYEAGQEITVPDVATTYTAQYEAATRQYTITFDSNGGTAVADITENYGTEVAAPTAPTKASDADYDYTFSHWEDANGEEVEFPVTLTANMALKAVWTSTPGVDSETYTVVVNGTSGEYESGAKITLSAPAHDTEKRFTGWSDGTDTYEAGAEYTVTGDAEITAQWEDAVGYIKTVASYDGNTKKYTAKVYFYGQKAVVVAYGYEYGQYLANPSFEIGSTELDSELPAGFETIDTENRRIVNVAAATADSRVIDGTVDGGVLLGTYTFDYTGTDAFDEENAEHNIKLTTPGSAIDGVSDEDGFLYYDDSTDTLRVYGFRVSFDTIAVDAVQVVTKLEVTVSLPDKKGHTYANIGKIFYREKGTEAYTEITFDNIVDEAIRNDESSVAQTSFTVKIDTVEKDKTYEVVISKNGYITYTQEITIAEGANTISATLIGGDIKVYETDFCGNGKVDYDDFVRVIRGLYDNDTDEYKAFMPLVDLNEDTVINVKDLEIIKYGFGKSYESK